jgi:prepilin-type processing-associated H-X9-DG protein
MRHTTRRFDTAFTLPGLAAVVTLTGLLGLFLAPLVVQQKSQQESNICLSNLRRIGQATLMYVQDYDQNMPLTTSNVSGQWLTNFMHLVPAKWSSLTTHPAVIGSKCIWPNTALPYGITLETLKCPSQEAYKVSLSRFTYDTPLAPPAALGYTMNGLLSTYPLASVANPTRVPLIWEGRGRSGFLGGVLQNPLLVCADGTQQCRFNSAEAGNSAANGGTGSMFGLNGSIWTHGRDNNWLFVDGHVEVRKLAAAVSNDGSYVDTDANVDPYRNYNERGIPQFFHTDGAFPIAFRPDR